MIRILLCLIVLSVTSVKASHIAGGGFSLRHLEGYNYNLNLHLYFDAASADPGMFEADPWITVSIYEKWSNTFIQTVEMERISADFMVYLNDTCYLSSFRTRLMK